MFLLFAKYKGMLRSCLLITIIAAAYYGFHYLMQQQRELGYQTAITECTAKRLVAEQTARAKEIKLSKQIEDAEHAATIRTQENKKLSVSLAVTNRKLRDTTTAMRSELPSDSIEAIRQTADAVLTVFGECTGEYTAMAENATGHANDVVTLSDAWPKQ